MKKHIKKIVILSVLAIAVIYYLVNYSYPAALRTMGITWTPGSQRVEVFSEFNRDRIIVYFGAENTRIARVWRDRIFWRPVSVTAEEFRNPETGLISLYWSKSVERNQHLGVSSSPRNDDGELQLREGQMWLQWQDWGGVRRDEILCQSITTENWVSEYNALYYGRNATALIVIPQEKLPPGVAIRIRQYNNEFLIHLISYGSQTIPGGIPTDPLSEVNVYDLISTFIKN